MKPTLRQMEYLVAIADTGTFGAAAKKTFVSQPSLSAQVDAVRQMAAMGGSIAILPSLYAISEAKLDPQLFMRPINHPLAQRDIGLIWRHSSPLIKKFENVGRVIVEVANSIMT
ncbi:MAG: LysR family transcriptional regulator [Hellea sp.]